MKLSAITPVLLGLTASAVNAYSVEYSTETGYFLQDESSTDPSTFDYTAVNFGLINRTYPADSDLKKPSHHTQWERFYNQVQQLNKDAAKNVEYKVLFLGRHGEGYHNAAESFYGTPAWNCYWAELDGNTTSTWKDAALTPAGISQALKAHNFWQSQITEQRIHTPDKYYVSPLTRTLQTANYTFNGLALPKNSSPFNPTVKELFREGISIHTCDHRRSKSYIRNLFPEWKIENGFAEEDQLWNGVTAETSAAQDVRSTTALNDVFLKFFGRDGEGDGEEGQTFVSVTAHSGEISSILRVLGHRTFSLSTGAVIPVLVRAERKGGGGHSSIAWTVSPHCTAPPVTSVSACVCPSSAVPVTTPLVTDL